jgi:hypothetical protein
MEKLEFSQEELRYLVAFLNVSVQSGKLQIGDLFILLPLVQKLQAKIKKIDTSKADEIIKPKGIIKN